MTNKIIKETTYGCIESTEVKAALQYHYESTSSLSIPFLEHLYERFENPRTLLGGIQQHVLADTDFLEVVIE